MLVIPDEYANAALLGKKHVPGGADGTESHTKFG
jgi:hypothetical protein